MRRNYRRRRRMKRPGQHQTAKSVFIIVFCLVLCIVLTVMLGNYLKNKAASTMPDPSETTDSAETTSPPKDDDTTPMDTKEIEAGYIDLSASAVGGKNAAQVADDFLATAYTAASFELRDEFGSLLYTSEVASALGQTSASSLDIKELVGLLSQRGVYTVGCFASSAFSDGVTDEMCGVILSYETALVRELVGMGVDEILFSSIPVAPDDMGAALSYIEAMQEAASDKGRIGVVISHRSLTSDGIAVIAKELSDAADFIAVDMRGFEYDDIYEATDSFVRTNEMYISRYSMRLLLPMCDNEIFLRQTEALGANGVCNWQIIK